MVTEGNTCLQKAISSVLTALVLMAIPFQCVSLADHPDTAVNSTLEPRLMSTLLLSVHTEAVEEPRVLKMHRPCKEEHLNFCANDGQCMYPQEDDIPSCVCTPSFGGQRCLHFMAKSQGLYIYEEIVVITVGVAISVVFLIVIILCCVRIRCNKSTPLIKSDGSLNSV